MKKLIFLCCQVDSHIRFSDFPFPSSGFGKEGERLSSSPTITPKPITYHENLMSIFKLVKPLLVLLFILSDAVIFKSHTSE